MAHRIEPSTSQRHMESLVTRLSELKQKVNGLTRQMNIREKGEHIAELEEKSVAPDLWNDPNAAQNLMQEIARLKREVTRWQALENHVEETLELAELGDTDLLDELSEELTKLEAQTDKMELEVVFTGAYDHEDAIISIHAGAGGTDAQDWAEMLERMYLRWAENNGYTFEELDRSEGEEAGLKSVTLSIRGGDYPYGYLQSEQGVHRLVRISPFNASGKRQTSFAKVELWPDIQGEINIDLNPNDLRIDTFRAGGAGGQHVQKNDTAVRITHAPTGIVVQCQNQRSQAQNRDRALQILKSRLFELEQKKKDSELAKLKGENVDAGWGNQIRSYVLHPYHMVKDLRTAYEMTNTNAVLNGELSGFMQSYLRAQLEKSTD